MATGKQRNAKNMVQMKELMWLQVEKKMEVGVKHLYVIKNQWS